MYRVTKYPKNVLQEPISESIIFIAMSQFSSLLMKNWYYWKRDTCCCTCQIVTTIVFALFLLLIKALSASSAVNTPDTKYLDPSGMKFPADLTFIRPPPPSMVTSQAALLTYYATSINATKMAFMKNCNFINSNNRAQVGGVVALITANDWMYNSLNTFFTSLGFITQRFNSVADLNNTISDANFGYSNMANGVPYGICFGISFTADSGNSWAYNLHYNTTRFGDIPDSTAEQEQLYRAEDPGFSGVYYKYFSSGAMVVQALIDSLILMNSTSSNTAYFANEFVQLPVHAYSNNGLFAATNSGQIDTYVIFPLLVIFLGFIYHMLSEKEKRSTENLRNMGMSLAPYYLSWYAFYFLVMLCCSFVWTLIAKFSFFINSNFIIIWLMFVLTGITMLSLAFIVCAFFVTAKPGVLTGIILFFVLYAISIGRGTIDVPTETIYTWFSLSIFSALSCAGYGVTLLESQNNYGFGFDNINQVINYYTYSTFIIFSIVEAVVFFLIGIYLDQVWPTEIGLKKHPLFFLGLGKSKEKDSGEAIKVDDEYMKLNYEPLDLAMEEEKKKRQNCIIIHHLRKVYSNGKVAVHDLNLEMFDNQIFALLGHNGAGKTTTISMMSGLLPQTSGGVDICGFDTKTQDSEIKRIMGVCPQTNPIYDNLTCREHLELYGNIKLGGTRKVTDQEIDQILTDIDLRDKKDFVAGRLSGGQKRKLCIGIAFIGGSKVILLDEPTSGMDTYARRFLWEMIKKYKKDRIIILCTHYMDEADFLGDRFGIMGEGRLITCGSSLFLKKRFGVGYDLTIVKESIQAPTKTIDDLIKKMIPKAEKQADISMEIKYRLPHDESPKFEGLFKELEEHKQKYGVQTFGISLTTMEEVFLKVAVGLHEKTDKMTGEQRKALVDNELDFDLDSIRVKGPFEVFAMHFWALSLKRFIYFKRDYKGLFCEVVLPILIIVIGLSFTLITFIKEPVGKIYSPANYYKNTVNSWLNIPSNVTNPASFTTVSNYLKGISGFSVAYTSANTTQNDFQDTLFNKNTDVKNYFNYYLQLLDTSNHIYSYSTWYNTTVPTAPLIANNIMNSAIYKLATGNASASITVGFAGLKLASFSKTAQNTASGIIAVFIFALAYSFIPAGVILYIVKEREINAKHQQIVSGVSVYAYWLSNLLIDTLKYIIPGIFCALSVLIYNVEVFTTGDHYGMVWALVIFYGPSIMAFTYLTSFLFNSAESAQIATFVFNFLAGFVLTLLSLALRFLSSTRNMAPYFPELILDLFPTYDFAWGLFQISTVNLWRSLYSLGSVPNAWDRWGALINFIYMIVVPVVCMLVIFFIELKTYGIDPLNKEGQSILDLAAGDEDVKKEREDVMKQSDYSIKVVDFAKEYTMISKRPGCCNGSLVTKKVAVKGVTFGVKKGDCFGLLGTNGAGKTTTFKALSGEIAPSYGKCYIDGMDLAKDMNKVRYLIGYCPQFDALLPNLTSKEHLELFAAIKGIPSNMREKLIQEKLQQLNLKQFEHVQAGTYSGGNKRKLSVAIALLGNPPIILLDEPSSGMDPEARRFMWSIIGKISSEKKHSSVVLTTHSMEEAEALSTKLAIMVEGSFQCIGPVQKLKNKYGKGFEVEIKIDLPTKADIEQLKSSAQVQGDGNFNRENVQQLLRMFNLGHLEAELKKGGKLDSIHSQVISYLNSKVRNYRQRNTRTVPEPGGDSDARDGHRVVPETPLRLVPAHREREHLLPLPAA